MMATMKRPCRACEHPAELHELVPIEGAAGVATIWRYFECRVIGCACQRFEASPYAQ